MISQIKDIIVKNIGPIVGISFITIAVLNIPGPVATSSLIDSTDLAPSLELTIDTPDIIDNNDLRNNNLEPSEETMEEVKEIVKLSVDDSHVYYFNTKEEALQVLQSVIDETVGDKYQSTVTYADDTEDSEDTEANKPIINFKKRPSLQIASDDIPLSTAAASSLSIISDYSEVFNQSVDETVTELSFQESIDIEVVADEHQSLNQVDEVVSDLLKQNITPDTYYVESGDSPYSIALDYGMSLDEIYALNEGLEEKATSIHIGDPIVVEKLVPELSVVEVTRESYLKPIPYESVSQEDDTIYKGLEIPGVPGVDGVKLVTSDISRSNDEVIEETLIEETIVSEPINEVLLIGTKPIPETGSVGFIVKPTNYYRINAYFGSYGSRWVSSHTGVDFKVSTGTSVKAADGGVVTFAGWHDSYGYVIDIDHGNGVCTRYAHNSKLLVSVGDEVGQGQLISKSGSTGNSSGPHLHFELIFDGTPVDPLDWYYRPYEEYEG